MAPAPWGRRPSSLSHWPPWGRRSAGGSRRFRSGAPAAEPVPESPLATARHDYREEHGAGRVVAEIGLRLERRGAGAAELVLEPSAVGPLVEPIPGFRGVRGGNHRTALELERSLADGLSVRTRPRDGSGAARPGRVGQVRRGALPERRLGDDGRIRRALSAAATVSGELLGGTVGAGTWTSEVLVQGRVRLAVDFSFDGEQGAILDVRAGPAEVHP